MRAQRPVGPTEWANWVELSVWRRPAADFARLGAQVVPILLRVRIIADLTVAVIRGQVEVNALIPGTGV